MKRLFTFLFSVGVLAASAQSLALKWKTDTLLRVPESVLLDAKNNVLYVANIDGQPDGKDGVGSIAKVSPTGKIINAAWVTGLDAPKGMGLYKNNLYVADISKVTTIDIATGKITASVEIPDAKFLNDITIDAKGNVYVSDTGASKIYVVKDGKATLYFESAELKGVNGLLALGNTLYVVDFATGQNYKLSADKKLTPFAKTAEGADGVVLVGKEEYLVSSWNGQVDFVNAKGEVTKLLDTREQKWNAADIEFDAKTNTLFVPTFFANTVMAYTFKK
ncbi:SMP-30/gluconolactonase/LRE family protein [Chryseolinea lacunae]|uniref:ATP/GTP-binding protein n=1 Tax=Chryseolinea lacunae TaxID=2801331 RepID=A0ABS1KVL2_9BACT|nr:ATP/GTP-binding protein [Chryseolinea lacunae]MBL0743233.1 ATP/GTP-binding protein [Chryseolinea lacunae]